MGDLGKIHYKFDQHFAHVFAEQLSIEKPQLLEQAVQFQRLTIFKMKVMAEKQGLKMFEYSFTVLPITYSGLVLQKRMYAYMKIQYAGPPHVNLTPILPLAVERPKLLK